MRITNFMFPTSIRLNLFRMRESVKVSLLSLPLLTAISLLLQWTPLNKDRLREIRLRWNQSLPTNARVRLNLFSIIPSKTFGFRRLNYVLKLSLLISFKIRQFKIVLADRFLKSKTTPLAMDHGVFSPFTLPRQKPNFSQNRKSKLVSRQWSRRELPIKLSQSQKIGLMIGSMILLSFLSLSTIKKLPLKRMPLTLKYSGLLPSH